MLLQIIGTALQAVGIGIACGVAFYLVLPRKEFPMSAKSNSGMYLLLLAFVIAAVVIALTG